MGLSTLVLIGVLAQAPSPEPRAGLIHAAIAAHVVAQFADVATTEYVLGKGGFHEANPVLRWASHDPVPMAIAKGGYAVGTSYLLIRLHRTHPRIAVTAALASAGLTSYVAHRNAQLGRHVR